MSVTSLNWGQLLGQMTTPPQETYQERAIRLALDLQGILHLAQRVQEEVHQAVGETEAEIGGEEPVGTQGDPDDFFAGIS